MQTDKTIPIQSISIASIGIKTPTRVHPNGFSISRYFFFLISRLRHLTKVTNLKTKLIDN